MEPMEIYYLIMNKPYFKVFVLSNGRKVKSFIQLASVTEKGQSSFLKHKGLKSAWRKPEKPIMDGLKFVTYVDLKNAIPLKIITETKFETSALWIKEYKTETISEDLDKQGDKPKSGLPETLIEIAYPPTVLFQEIEAVFVNEVAARKASTSDNLKGILPYLLIGAAIILVIVMNGGKIPFLQG